MAPALPPTPDAAALAAVRAARNYSLVRDELPGVPEHVRRLALCHAAQAGNAPGVLAFLDAGTLATAEALKAALGSRQPLGPHAARLLFDAGARLAKPH